MKAVDRIMRDAGMTKQERRSVRRRMRTHNVAINNGTRRVRQTRRGDEGYDVMWSLAAMFFGLKAQPDFDPDTGLVLVEGGEHDDDDAGVA